jgi:hypothetical protein
VKGLAPLACKTDRIDAWVLAELARRDLVPAIWLPLRWILALRLQSTRCLSTVASVRLPVLATANAVRVRDRYTNRLRIKQIGEAAHRRQSPSWLELRGLFGEPAEA